MASSEYNFSSRLLHRLALQSTVMAEISFDIENALVKKSGIEFPENHVFISGLARSGTTMLMRYLYESGDFRSLTYMDMPFILMPNLWKKISTKKSGGEIKERAHQDGIMVSFESPEAFEEVFWRVFTGDQYIGPDRLDIQKVNSEVLNKFGDYIQNVILSGENGAKLRYLSKNNNNILRFPYLSKYFPAAKIVVPFRDPLQHALSLLSQHSHFSKVQSKDKFSLEYMNWLGHFEFGLNQKPFHFDDHETFRKMQNTDKSRLNYWLLSWKNYYDYALNNASDKMLFFSYERFCSSPSKALAKLFNQLQVSKTPEGLNPFTPSEKHVSEFDSEILDQCMDIYKSLIQRFEFWYND